MSGTSISQAFQGLCSLFPIRKSLLAVVICINKLEWFILSEKTKKSKGKLWTSVLKKVVTDLSTGGDAELRSPELQLTAFRFRNCMWQRSKIPYTAITTKLLLRRREGTKP